jgi:hypothetical protein
MICRCPRTSDEHDTPTEAHRHPQSAGRSSGQSRKDADPDIPVRIAAKAEYAKLH